MYIVKSRSFSDSWFVWHKDLTNTTDYALRLNTSAAEQSLSGFWNSTAPSSTLISLGNGILVNNATYVAYAFKSVAGYSKFGSYTGNGSDNGPIVETGFEPAFVMIKRSSGTGNWQIWDNKRSTTNTRDKLLFPNDSAAEQTLAYVDFLSNGFQIVDASGATGGTNVNINGSTYIYMAFASDQSADPVLADSFGVETYQGNGGTQSLAGYGFTPSMIWFKGRTVAYDHGLYDSVRGGGSLIYPSLSQAASTVTNGVLSFDSSGVTVGSNNKANASDSTYVGWAWKANPIPTINTDGTIQSIVSANQASGFSIVKYTGNATSGATVGHGLSNAPDVVIAKGLSGSGSSWWVRDKNVSSTDVLELNSSNAQANYSSVFNNTDPTSTVVTLGSGDTNRNNETQILYCFHSIAGFSKMGTYTGTGATHAITGVGFQPDWIMGKEVDGVDSWEMVDSARGINKMVYANGANAEVTNTNFTSFDSDGFTLSSATSINENGKTYIYMAFKENPSPVVPAGQMAYLVVAGGAGGGGTVFPNKGGGGGAGGLRTSFGSTSGGGASVESNLTLSSGTYTITVGAGGGAAANGVASTISGTGTVSTVGGGQGGAITVSGTAGGSGGGTGGNNGGSITGGAGTAGEGFAGGTTAGNAGYDGSGGGGAAQAGGNGGFRNTTGGVGGNGLAVSITGASVAYAGGGGGGSDSTSVGARPGGTGGGGAGGSYLVAGVNGTANLGGGAGAGGEDAQPGTGGSGVVILRMRTSDYSGSTTGSPTVTTTGEETVLTYTGSGTYVHS